MVRANRSSRNPVSDETTKPAMMTTNAVCANTVPNGIQALRSR